VPKMKLTLGAYYKPTGGSNFCANQFQAALSGNSLQQFTSNFQNGGWVAYGASMLPSGNYDGGVFFNAQVVGNSAQNAQSATLAKSVANGGDKGDEVCDDGSNPNSGEHSVCENPDGPDYTITGGEACGPGDTQVTYANEGVCDDGTEPQVTTPGTFTGLGVSSALNSGTNLITSANNIAGIVSSLLSSLLNSLASLAVNTVNNTVNNGLNGNGGGGGGGATGGGGIVGINSSTITGGGTNTIPSVALSCNPPTQTVSTTVSTVMGAVGGINNTDGTPPSYNWTSSDGQTGTGFTFSPVYYYPGVYTVTLSDSTGDPQVNCRVIAQ